VDGCRKKSQDGWLCAEAPRPRASGRNLGLPQRRVGLRHEAVQAEAEVAKVVKVAESYGCQEASPQAREKRE